MDTEVGRMGSAVELERLALDTQIGPFSMKSGPGAKPGFPKKLPGDQVFIFRVYFSYRGVPKIKISGEPSLRSE